MRHRLIEFGFLSTLSLRRATLNPLETLIILKISIHALLAESDTVVLTPSWVTLISIHALLAESDTVELTPSWVTLISIHALLAESDPCAECLRL